MDSINRIMYVGRRLLRASYTADNCVAIGGGGGGGVDDPVSIVRELTIPSDVKRRELGIFRI